MDLSDILPADLEQKVKDVAQISMGTEISDEDIIHISCLCDQVNRNPSSKRYKLFFRQCFMKANDE